MMKKGHPKRCVVGKCAEDSLIGADRQFLMETYFFHIGLFVYAESDYHAHFEAFQYRPGDVPLDSS